MNKKNILKILKVINTIALCFIIGGAYGLMFTGLFQLIAGIIFIFVFPKNTFIYIYFALVLLFFFMYMGNIFGWQLIIPVSLMFFLTYIIHVDSKKYTLKNRKI